MRDLRFEDSHPIAVPMAWAAARMYVALWGVDRESAFL